MKIEYSIWTTVKRYICTLVVLVHHDHATVPQARSGRRVASGNVAALDVLRHGGGHVDGLRKDTYRLKLFVSGSVALVLASRVL